MVSRRNMKKLLCDIKAIPFFMRTGVWVPHEYVEVKQYKTNIAATEDGFRETDSLQHADYERLYVNATVTVLKCEHCGYEEKSWHNKEPRRV